MTEAFHYKGGELYCESVPVAKIAQKVGTPCYVYSQDHFVRQVHAIKDAFRDVQPLVCYAVKANSNLGLLRAMALAGAGFDTVSKGEIFRALRAGAEPGKIVFAGVGKQADEIEYALEQGILMFNVESESELELISKVAARRKLEAPIALRINPDVDPQTHKYISTGKSENKFGIDLKRAEDCLRRIRELKNLRLKGIHIHIGSQILKNDRHGEAIDRVLPFIERCRKMDFPLEYLNVGGGYGIAYDVGQGVDITEFAKVMLPKIKHSGLKMVSEPGRFISGNGGVLLTQVVYVKKSAEKDFLIVDGAMNDLIRPTIYQAFHKIWPVRQQGLKDGGVMGADSPLTEAALGADAQVYDVVGPICESGDYFALGRKLPKMAEGELVTVFSAGAYGASMASNYNTRGRGAEVIVSGHDYWVARERETLEDLIRGERLTPREVFKA